MNKHKNITIMTSLAIVAALILISPTIVFGNPNTGQIRGVILDAENNEPIPGVTVLLVNEYAGTFSDEEGRFSLSKLSPGMHSLQISSIGYEAQKLDSVIVDDTGAAEISVKLIPQAIPLKSITVTPGRFSIMGSEAVAQQTLTQQEISTMPQLGDDFFRAVTRLPGMTSNDFSAKFTVRGGEYDEVLVMLDGLQIYEPFHFKDIDGGVMSIIDVAAVESIDLMTGGFPARYGDKMSAAFKIKSRQVPPDENRISVGLSFINARALAEGKFHQNRGSWLVSARRGYIDYLLKLSGADDNIKPTYYDIFSKLQYQLSEKHSLAAHILHAGDDLRFIADDEDTGDSLITDYGNSYAWLTMWSEFTRNLFAQTVVSVGKVKHNRYGHDQDGPRPMFIAKDFEDFQFIGLKSDWEYEYSNMLILKAGSEIQRRKATYDYLNQDFFYDYITSPDSSYIELAGIDSTDIPLEKSGTKLSGYLSGRFRVAEPLVAEIGLRYDHVSYSRDDDLSPRINFAYNFNDKTVLCVGWGYYYQSQGIDEIAIGDGETDFSPSQRAELRVAGIEHEFEDRIRFRIEVYDKLYTNLRPAYRNTFDAIAAFPELEDDRTKIYRKNAKSRGIEFYLKKDTGGKITWWASYAYAKVIENVDRIYFPDEDVTAYYNIVIPTPQDQRHTFYLDIHYRPTTRWRISTALQYHSGWPFTDAHLASQITPEGTNYWVQGGEQWGARHDEYQRFDLRINRYFPLSKGRITAFIEVLNVLDRKNVRAYQYGLRYYNGQYHVRKEPEHWFGRIPSFGISYDIDL
jgi:hypothetical protein